MTWKKIIAHDVEDDPNNLYLQEDHVMDHEEDLRNLDYAVLEHSPFNWDIHSFEGRNQILKHFSGSRTHRALFNDILHSISSDTAGLLSTGIDYEGAEFAQRVQEAHRMHHSLETPDHEHNDPDRVKAALAEINNLTRHLLMINRNYPA